MFVRFFKDVAVLWCFFFWQGLASLVVLDEKLIANQLKVRNLINFLYWWKNSTLKGVVFSWSQPIWTPMGDID